MLHQNLNLSPFKRKNRMIEGQKTPTEKQFWAIKNSLIVERFEKSVQLVNWQRTRNRPVCPPSAVRTAHVPSAYYVPFYESLKLE